MVDPETGCGLLGMLSVSAVWTGGWAEGSDEIPVMEAAYQLCIASSGLPRWSDWLIT